MYKGAKLNDIKPLFTLPEYITNCKILKMKEKIYQDMCEVHRHTLELLPHQTSTIIRDSREELISHEIV